MPFDDYQSGNNYNFGESFTVLGEYGGVSMIGNTRLGTESTIYIFENFLLSVFPPPGTRNYSDYSTEIGLHFWNGKSNYVGYPNFHYNILTCNLLGCPQTEYWCSTPQKFENISIIDDGNSITVNTNNISDCLISIASVNPADDYQESVFDQTEYTFITSIRPLSITIMKHYSDGIQNIDYIPYQAITGGTYSDDIVIDYWNEIYVPPGSILKFQNNVKIDVKGNFIVDGTANNMVTFTSANASPSPGDWKGIIVNGSANAFINYVKVQYAKTNLELVNNSNNINISNSTFTNALWEGIKLMNSEPTINNCTITDNGYYGILAYNSYSTNWTNVDFLGNTIRNNGYYGMAIQNSSPTMEDNSISSNGYYGIYGIFGSNPVLSENRIWANNNHGTRWYSSSSPYLYYKSSYDFGGCNEISYNEGDGVYASSSSYPKLGAGYPGNNNIYGNSGYEVSNHNSGSSYIYARYNWWGSSSGPSPSDIYGRVIYLPYLSSNECAIPLAASGVPPTIQVENSPAYYNAMGLQRYGNGQANAALQMFNRVINNFPNSEGAFFALQHIVEIMREKGQQDQILTFLTALSSDNIGTQLHWYADLQRVFILERTGNYEDAIQLIESVLQDSTIDTETEYSTALHRAMILSNGLQLNEAAVQAYTELLDSNPPEDLAVIAQGELERLAGRPPGLGKRAIEQTSITQLPDKFGLAQNYPNPFNPFTSIKYSLPEKSMIVVKIYDLMGREIKTLISRTENAGYKNVTWNGTNKDGQPVSSGMYFYRIDAVSKESNKEFHETKKMVLLR